MYRYVFADIDKMVGEENLRKNVIKAKLTDVGNL